MILYGYALSSASYRVRIALNLKGLEVATVPVHLRRGEQRQPEFLQLNSQGFVPALRLDDGEVLTQSMAIIEYLDERYPQPPLLPELVPQEPATMPVHPFEGISMKRAGADGSLWHRVASSVKG